MVHFEKLKLSDIDRISPFFSLSQTGTCDNTIGGSFMWRDFFNTEYAIIEGALVFKLQYLRDTTAFSMPLGENVLGALDKIDAYCEETRIPTVFCMATQSDVAQLRARFCVEAKKEADWSDYLYSAADLAAMRGRKYHGQKNHINRFTRENPVYDFRPIDSANLGAVRAFFEAQSARNTKDSPIFIEESAKVFELLDHYAQYRQTGLALYAAGRIAAFSIGEIVKDTLFVHVEKADPDIVGAQPMMVRGFVAASLEQGVVYVNREEDVGDRGLRMSKMSYHPCELIEKYTVTVTALPNG